jgi:hypothetical protein
MTVCSAIMNVVLFAKVSAMYPRVVIPSLAKRLEKPHFCHSYTSFSVWPRDHYILVQRFTMGYMPGFAKVVRGTLAMLSFSEVVCGTTSSLAPCRIGWIAMPLPTSLLISKLAAPYQTHGGTGCTGVPTPKIRSLADLSMTNHITR